MRLTAPLRGCGKFCPGRHLLPGPKGPGCTGIPHFIGFLGMARGLL